MKKKWMRLGIALSSFVALSGVASFAIVSGITTNATKYYFDGEIYNSKREALYDVIGRSETDQRYDNEYSYEWTQDGRTTLGSISDYKKIVSQNIDPKTVYSTSPIPMDPNTSQINPDVVARLDTSSNNVVEIYQGKNNVISTSVAEAAETFFTPNVLYFFNGIYFKNQTDIQKYLNSTNAFESGNGHQLWRLQAPNGGNKLSTPFSNGGTSSSNSIQNVNDELTNFIAQNAVKLIRVVDGNGKVKYYDTDQKDKIIDSINNDNGKNRIIPYQKVYANNNKTLYVTDNSATAEDEIIGPYALESSADISDFNDATRWKRLRGDAPPNWERNITDNHLTKLFLKVWDSEIGGSESFNIVNRDTLRNVYIPYANPTAMQNAMDKYILSLSLDTSYRGNEILDLFINTSNKLLQTKRFSSFYWIPIMYQTIMNQIIYGRYSTNILAATKTYFLTICNQIDQILFQKSKTRFIIDGYKVIPEAPSGRGWAWYVDVNNKDTNPYYSTASLFGIDDNDTSLNLKPESFIKKMATTYPFFQTTFSVINKANEDLANGIASDNLEQVENDLERALSKDLKNSSSALSEDPSVVSGMIKYLEDNFLNLAINNGTSSKPMSEAVNEINSANYLEQRNKGNPLLSKYGHSSWVQEPLKEVKANDNSNDAIYVNPQLYPEYEDDILKGFNREQQNILMRTAITIGGYAAPNDDIRSYLITGDPIFLEQFCKSLSYSNMEALNSWGGIERTDTTSNKIFTTIFYNEFARKKDERLLLERRISGTLYNIQSLSEYYFALENFKKGIFKDVDDTIESLPTWHPIKKQWNDEDRIATDFRDLTGYDLRKLIRADFYVYRDAELQEKNHITGINEFLEQRTLTDQDYDLWKSFGRSQRLFDLKADLFNNGVIDNDYLYLPTKLTVGIPESELFEKIAPDGSTDTRLTSKSLNKTSISPTDEGNSFSDAKIRKINPRTGKPIEKFDPKKAQARVEEVKVLSKMLENPLYRFKNKYHTKNRDYAPMDEWESKKFSDLSILSNMVNTSNAVSQASGNNSNINAISKVEFQGMLSKILKGLNSVGHPFDSSSGYISTTLYGADKIENISKDIIDKAEVYSASKQSPYLSNTTPGKFISSENTAPSLSSFVSLLDEQAKKCRSESQSIDFYFIEKEKFMEGGVLNQEKVEKALAKIPATESELIRIAATVIDDVLPVQRSTSIMLEQIMSIYDSYSSYRPTRSKEYWDFADKQTSISPSEDDHFLLDTAISGEDELYDNLTFKSGGYKEASMMGTDRIHSVSSIKMADASIQTNSELLSAKLRSNAFVITSGMMNFIANKDQNGRQNGDVISKFAENSKPNEEQTTRDPALIAAANPFLVFDRLALLYAGLGTEKYLNMVDNARKDSPSTKALWSDATKAKTDANVDGEPNKEDKKFKYNQFISSTANDNVRVSYKDVAMLDEYLSYAHITPEILAQIDYALTGDLGSRIANYQKSFIEEFLGKPKFEEEEAKMSKKGVGSFQLNNQFKRTSKAYDEIADQAWKYLSSSFITASTDPFRAMTPLLVEDFQPKGDKPGPVGNKWRGSFNNSFTIAYETTCGTFAEPVIETESESSYVINQYSPSGAGLRFLNEYKRSFNEQNRNRSDFVAWTDQAFNDAFPKAGTADWARIDLYTKEPSNVKFSEKLQGGVITKYPTATAEKKSAKAGDEVEISQGYSQLIYAYESIDASFSRYAINYQNAMTNQSIKAATRWDTFIDIDDASHSPQTSLFASFYEPATSRISTRVHTKNLKEELTESTSRVLTGRTHRPALRASVYERFGWKPDSIWWPVNWEDSIDIYNTKYTQTFWDKELQRVETRKWNERANKNFKEADSHYYDTVADEKDSFATRAGQTKLAIESLNNHGKFPIKPDDIENIYDEIVKDKPGTSLSYEVREKIKKAMKGTIAKLDKGWTNTISRVQGKILTPGKNTSIVIDADESRRNKGPEMSLNNPNGINPAASQKTVINPFMSSGEGTSSNVLNPSEIDTIGKNGALRHGVIQSLQENEYASIASFDSTSSEYEEGSFHKGSSADLDNPESFKSLVDPKQGLTSANPRELISGKTSADQSDVDVIAKRRGSSLKSEPPVPAPRRFLPYSSDKGDLLAHMSLLPNESPELDIDQSKLDENGGLMAGQTSGEVTRPRNINRADVDSLSENFNRVSDEVASRYVNIPDPDGIRPVTHRTSIHISINPDDSLSPSLNSQSDASLDANKPSEPGTSHNNPPIHVDDSLDGLEFPDVPQEQPGGGSTDGPNGNPGAPGHGDDQAGTSGTNRPMGDSNFDDLKDNASNGNISSNGNLSNTHELDNLPISDETNRRIHEESGSNARRIRNRRNKAKTISKKIGNILGKIGNALSLLGPYVEAALITTQLLMDILSLFKPERISYYYSYMTPDGQEYIYDAGGKITETKFLFGAKSYKTPDYSIYSARLLSPIAFTKPFQSDGIYLNGKIYSDNSVTRPMIEDYVNQLFDHNSSLATELMFSYYNQLSIVYTFHKEYKNLIEVNPPAGFNDPDTTKITFPTISGLAKDVINDFIDYSNKLAISTKPEMVSSKYSKQFIQSYQYNGISTTDQVALNDKIKQNIVDFIRPVYYAILPMYDQFTNKFSNYDFQIMDGVWDFDSKKVVNNPNNSGYSYLIDYSATELATGHENDGQIIGGVYNVLSPQSYRIQNTTNAEKASRERLFNKFLDNLTPSILSTKRIVLQRELKFSDHKYSTFSNSFKDMIVEPTLIYKVTENNGNVIYFGDINKARLFINKEVYNLKVESSQVLLYRTYTYKGHVYDYDELKDYVFSNCYEV